MHINSYGACSHRSRPVWPDWDASSASTAGASSAPVMAKCSSRLMLVTCGAQLEHKIAWPNRDKGNFIHLGSCHCDFTSWAIHECSHLQIQVNADSCGIWSAKWDVLTWNLLGGLSRSCSRQHCAYPSKDQSKLFYSRVRTDVQSFDCEAIFSVLTIGGMRNQEAAAVVEAGL